MILEKKRKSARRIPKSIRDIWKKENASGRKRKKTMKLIERERLKNLLNLKRRKLKRGENKKSKEKERRRFEKD